jgi:hypothetical protein
VYYDAANVAPFDPAGTAVSLAIALG